MMGFLLEAFSIWAGTGGAPEEKHPTSPGLRKYFFLEKKFKTILDQNKSDPYFKYLCPYCCSFGNNVEQLKFWSFSINTRNSE